MRQLRWTNYAQSPRFRVGLLYLIGRRIGAVADRRVHTVALAPYLDQSLVRRAILENQALMVKSRHLCNTK